MTLPPNLNVYISAAVFVIGAYLMALYVGLIVWTFRDIHARSRDVLAQIMTVLLVGFFTLPGLFIYMLLRPHSTLAEEYERSLTEEAVLQDLEQRRVCPGCQQSVEPDFVVCPSCHEQLRLRCVGCGRLLDPRWDVCPYCGRFPEQGQHPDGKAAAVLVEALDGPAQVEGPEPLPVVEQVSLSTGASSGESSEVGQPSSDGTAASREQ